MVKEYTKLFDLLQSSVDRGSYRGGGGEGKSGRGGVGRDVGCWGALEVGFELVKLGV